MTSQNELNARASIAGDLYREGEIRRSECFRLEMDAFLGRDTSPVRFEKNNDWEELQELWALYPPDKNKDGVSWSADLI